MVTAETAARSAAKQILLSWRYPSAEAPSDLSRVKLTGEVKYDMFLIAAKGLVNHFKLGRVSVAPTKCYNQLGYANHSLIPKEMS